MMRPLYDHVLVRRCDAATRSPGGLILPGNVGERPQEADVLAVGNGRRLVDGSVLPLDVKVGDRVLFAKHCGETVRDDLLVLREDDILGVLES